MLGSIITRRLIRRDRKTRRGVSVLLKEKKENKISRKTALPDLMSYYFSAELVVLQNITHVRVVQEHSTDKYTRRSYEKSNMIFLPATF